jgi:predicted TIM-barrel fold metal-dependent hydrolase
MSSLRAIDGDGHLMELMGTTLPDYLEEPYLSRSRADRAMWDGVGATFPWLPSDCWDRNLGSELFKGRGNRPEEWLEQLERGPLDAAVLYPSFLLLIGAAYDPDWSIALCRAFNQWVADEFVAKGEGRVHCVGVLPPQDPEEAAKELAHVHALGLVAAMIPADGPHLLGSARFDAVWRAAEAHNVPIAVHAAGTHLSGHGAFPKFIQTHTFNHPASVLAQFTSMMFEGVFTRFPELRVAFLEVGATWVPWYVDRMDEEFEMRGAAEAPALTAKPSEIVRPGGNVFFGLESDERLLGATLELIGDTAMYASDWPHWDNEYPGSLHRIFERTDLTDEMRANVLASAAERFYGRSLVP